MYLLGYGDTGKSTLRQTFKNLSTWSAFWGANVKASTIVVNTETKGLEVDQRVVIEDALVQVVDFGGQHHYHHFTHILLSGVRSVNVVVLNPLEVGYQEQLWYWMRLLTLKSSLLLTPDGAPTLQQVIVVFSRRDLSSRKIRESDLKDLVDLVRENFKQFVFIRGWFWLNCTETGDDNMRPFLKLLKETAKAVIAQYQLIVPDSAVPDKILGQVHGAIFYGRKSLEAIIAPLVEKNSKAASNWVETLKKGNDFFSIKLHDGAKEIICTDLERFGKDILGELIQHRGEEVKSEWKKSELISTAPAFLSTRKATSN